MRLHAIQNTLAEIMENGINVLALYLAWADTSECIFEKSGKFSF